MDRKTYIGSSDAPAILSDDWTGLYAEKMGLKEREDLTDNFKVQFGAYVEPFHLDWLAKIHVGWKWSKHQADGEQHFARFTTGHKTPLGSHPDALMALPDTRILPVEVKHTGRFRSADEAADFYMPQLQHHMLCWGVDHILMSVIVGNEEPDECWIGASQEWQAHYLDRCDRFWKHVTEAYAPSKPMHLGATKVKVPTAIKNTVPYDGMKKRDLSESNRAKAVIIELNQTRAASEKHAKAKEDLKALMADDEREIYLPDVFEIKRDARGAKRIKIHDPEFGCDFAAE